MLDVSIVIVSYNTRDVLRNCLVSIYRETKALTFEIIISDNGSTDGTIEMLETEFPHVILLKNGTNLGFGRACNIGADRAKGNHIFLLNSDTVLLNNAILILITFLAENPKAGACGGNLFDEHRKPLHSFKRSFPSISWELCSMLYNYPEKIYYGKNIEFNHTGKNLKVACITGADLMIRRKVWDTLQGFDLDFFMYYEDAELSYRIKKAGYASYSVPAAEIMHLSGKSVDTKDLQKLMHLEGRRIYFLKTHSRIYYQIICFLSGFDARLKIMTAKILGNKVLYDFFKENIRIWELYKEQQK